MRSGTRFAFQGLQLRELPNARCYLAPGVRRVCSVLGGLRLGSLPVAQKPVVRSILYLLLLLDTHPACT